MTTVASAPSAGRRTAPARVFRAQLDAAVRLGALARPALISWVTAPWSDGVALEAESSARAW